jgi:hypothetical protein
VLVMQRHQLVGVAIDASLEDGHVLARRDLPAVCVQCVEGAVVLRPLP